MRIFLTALVILFYSGIANAQTTYIPLKSDTNGVYALKKQILAAKDADIKAIVDVKNKVELQKIYTERATETITELDSNYILLKTPVNLYANIIFQEILNKNPELKARKLRLFINKDAEANALSTGDGTIEINLGLIAMLDNESQLAFIICHEISHYILNHSNSSIQDILIDYNSKETQDKVKAIAKNKYNQATKLDELLTSITLKHRKISRFHEKQADSLGFLYLSKTIYNEAETLSALAILDHIEDEENKVQLDYSKIFNFTDYPFRPEWLNENDMITISQKKTDKQLLLADSLKTHPDCKIRIVYIQKMLLQPPVNKKVFYQDKDLFYRIKNICQYEVIEYLFYSRQLSECIYRSLKLQLQHPDDSYIATQIGKSMNIINAAKSTHEVGKYVPTVSKKYYPNLYDLTTLLKEWRTTDITNINMRFMLQYYEKFNDEEYLYTSYLAAKSNYDTTTADLIKNDYLNKYPTGTYSTKF
ncbi:M48 family metallopeptidase [Cytophaga aurantiaca]|uniref:M48 family metallopeptidase n=1 Tax=Cytophaga aurantiaca TaxID=29530 RepID=UPI000369FC44|nr:M48 family metallopeptidase [Cytophaga aurantiaca]